MKRVFGAAALAAVLASLPAVVLAQAVPCYYYCSGIHSDPVARQMCINTCVRNGGPPNEN